MEKLWGGRFAKPMDPKAFEFSASISVDQKLARYDIEGSIAHAKMLAKTGIITKGEGKRIVKGLKELLADVLSGKFKADARCEDVHTNVQVLLERKIGKVAQKLHTARSRNDQIALDTRLYVREEAKFIISCIVGLQRSILDLSRKYSQVIIPGYTHLQPGQPVLLCHHLLAYVEMLERDKDRLCQAGRRADEMPLGSAALAGTTLPIDRKYLAKLLKFSKVSANSIDAVSSRDYVIEALSCLAILAMHLSRMCEDLILFSTQEFGFITIEESFCTGSSLMPQKKNPDILELIRAKTGKAYGNLISVLVVMKSLPLSYNRDMQEDKEPLFNSFEMLANSLVVLGRLLKGIRVNPARINEKFGDELMLATDVAEYLIKKGVASSKAQQIVGRMVRYCLDKKKKLSDLSIGEMRSFSNRFSKDVFRLLSPQASVRAKQSFGGTNPGQVKAALVRWQRRLKKK